MRSIIFTLTTYNATNQHPIRSQIETDASWELSSSCRAKANKEQSKDGGKELNEGHREIYFDIVYVLYEKEISINGEREEVWAFVDAGQHICLAAHIYFPIQTQ